MKEELTVGNKAPSFEGEDAQGHVISSKNLKGHLYVLYFYPKDDTPGCTKEACHFRDVKSHFDTFDAELIGVSPDTPQSHAQFISKYGLNFTLLSDKGHRICEAFGVWQEKNAYGKMQFGVVRSTFVIDNEGIIRWIEKPVKVEGHAERVIEALKQLKDTNT